MFCYQDYMKVQIVIRMILLQYQFHNIIFDFVAQNLRENIPMYYLLFNGISLKMPFISPEMKLKRLSCRLVCYQLFIYI